MKAENTHMAEVQDASRVLLEQHEALSAQVQRNEDLVKIIQTVNNTNRLSALSGGASHNLKRSQIGCAYYASSSQGINA